MRIEQDIRTSPSLDETLITKLPTIICEAASSDTEGHERHTQLLFKPTSSQRYRVKRGHQMSASKLLTSNVDHQIRESRQKKFNRRFKELPDNEQLIDYFSCALITDVILQGHLYITSEHFAFHSNVFGFITKLLIPTTSVTSITKERTAYIIPNAIAVFSKNRKHVFGTLLSRDATYKIMTKVWRINSSQKTTQSTYVMCEEDKKMDKNVSHSNSEGHSLGPIMANDDDFDDDDDDDDSSISGSCISLRDEQKNVRLGHLSTKKGKSTRSSSKVSTVDKCLQTIEHDQDTFSWIQYMGQLTTTDQWLMSSIILLTLLFLSAGILLHRISVLQHEYSMLYEPFLN